VDDASSFGVNLDGRAVTVTSAFVQDMWAASDSVQVLAGARWDDADRWGSELSPRIGVGWWAAPGWKLRASYGEAFRQPSVGELYFPFSGNPGLDAETSRSWELGVTRWFGSRLRIDLDGFWTSLDNLIEYDFATNTFANVATAKIKGAEAGVLWSVAKGLDVRAQATWLDTRGDDGRSLLRRPRWSGALTLAGRLGRRLRLDLTVAVIGRRADVDPVTFTRSAAAGAATADLALAWRVTPHADLTLRAINLLDRRYQEVLGYPAPRQRIIGGLRARF